MTIGVCATKTTPFQDVAKESYYYDAVNWAVEQGITEGMGDGLFAPGNSCTRAQVVTFLWRHAGKPQPNGNSAAFTDVEPGTWYSDPVAWAVAQGITDGMGEGKFAPDGTCTRGQIVTFLWRYAGKPTVTGAENPFTDVEEGKWYSEAVLWAVSEGITNGVSDTSFAPNDSCTRGQVVTFLYRYDQSLQTEEEFTESTPAETKPVETKPVETDPPETESAETETTTTPPSVGDDGLGWG